MTAGNEWRVGMTSLKPWNPAGGGFLTAPVRALDSLAARTYLAGGRCLNDQENSQEAPEPDEEGVSGSSAGEAAARARHLQLQEGPEKVQGGVKAFPHQRQPRCI